MNTLNRLSVIALFLTLSACGATSFQIPGEPENPRKFMNSWVSCGGTINQQGRVSFDGLASPSNIMDCMRSKGYVTSSYTKGSVKTIWIPTRKARSKTATADQACGGTSPFKGDLRKAANYFDCMKRKGFTPVTTTKDGFPSVLFTKRRASALQHKRDYGLCGASFKGGNVVIFNAYDPNNKIIRCLLKKGYKGIPIRSNTRVRLSRKKTSKFTTDQDLIACGANLINNEIILKQERLANVAICIEKKGYSRGPITQNSRSGYKIQ